MIIFIIITGLLFHLWSMIYGGCLELNSGTISIRYDACFIYIWCIAYGLVWNRIFWCIKDEIRVPKRMLRKKFPEKEYSLQLTLKTETKKGNFYDFFFLREKRVHIITVSFVQQMICSPILSQLIIITESLRTSFTLHKM